MMTYDQDVVTIAVLGEVHGEREAQESKWGPQSHPDGTHADWAELADWQKAITDGNAAQGLLTWQDILAEEYAEACAETDIRKLRAELIQVAAVAVAWVEDLDRREAL